MRLCRLFICFICLLGTSLLVGCIVDPNSSTSAKKTFTDVDGTVYYIINENYFSFDSYNILEVIVSDSEKFILYDTEDDNHESGIGEWIKDGVSYPISFMGYIKLFTDSQLLE